MSRVTFSIAYRLLSDGTVHQFQFDPYARPAGMTGLPLRLEARFTPDAVRYLFAMTWDGKTAQPPAGGFDSIDELWSWIQKYLITVGKWYRLTDRIIVFLNANSATMSIREGGVQAVFPELGEGEGYWIEFDGNRSITSFATRGEALTYAQNTWAGGTWSIREDYLVFIPDDLEEDHTLYIHARGDGAFSDDFSDDFDNGG